jgi:hypothetical protein
MAALELYRMPDILKPHAKLLEELATLLVGVAGESVTMVKRSAPEQALKLKKQTEWKIFLEFLKVMFNLADRLSVFYLPVQEQLLFMNGLEDAVSTRLKIVLAPALGPQSDDMEIVFTIGNAVADSRRMYERFRFVVTEDSKVKDELFGFLSEQISHLIEAPGNPMVTSAATLCASASIAAMKSLFEGLRSPSAQAQGVGAQPGHPDAGTGTGNEIKLISVMSTVQGEEVETRWGMHSRFRQDLKPEEAKELTRLMNRATQILGERYAALAFSADWMNWRQAGHA